MKKIILSLLTLSLIYSPLSAFDWSYSSLANSIFNYWSAVKADPVKAVPYLFLGGLAAFAGYTMYKRSTRPAVVKYLNDEEYLRSSEISIGGYSSRGQENILKYSFISKQEKMPEITLKQCAVYDQHNNDGGGHASCGYHTVKNLLAIRYILKSENQLSPNELRRLIDSQTYVQQYFGENGEWRNQVKENRKKSGLDLSVIGEENERVNLGELENGEWLAGDEIQSLFEQAQVSNQDYSIVSDVDNLEGNTIGIPVEHTLIEKPKIHLIAVNTGSVEHCNAHWFGIALHVKEDMTREYIVVDSKNPVHMYGGKVYEKECLKKIIASIEGESVVKKLQAPRVLRQQLGQALTEMSVTDDVYPLLLDRYREWGGSQVTLFKDKYGAMV